MYRRASGWLKHGRLRHESQLRMGQKAPKKTLESSNQDEGGLQKSSSWQVLNAKLDFGCFDSVQITLSNGFTIQRACGGHCVDERIAGGKQVF
jgi:hypothetical protein